MVPTLSLIGFGEAGMQFARCNAWAAQARVFDRLTLQAGSGADAKRADYAALGVTPCADMAGAVGGADVILSLVTADECAAAAAEAARHIAPGALFFDMNSVAPGTKEAAAIAMEQAGGRYVDVAVMAPVDPAGAAVPLLVSGPHAGDGAAMLAALGFTNIRIVAGAVGRASSIKMIRSVMIKGIEALTAEMMLAADRAGVVDDVLASLGGDWATRADYNLDRMMVHGVRRAAEMREVVSTLDQLGVEPWMTRGTVERQDAIGQRRLSPAGGLDDKLQRLANPAPSGAPAARQGASA
ncbi:MAG: DUF1932 domain-containing protein [Sphingopyxis sp.]